MMYDLIKNDERENSTCFSVQRGDINISVISQVCVCCECFDCHEAREAEDTPIYDEDGDVVDSELEDLCYSCSQYKTRVPCDGHRCQQAIEDISSINYCLKQPTWLNMCYDTATEARKARDKKIVALKNALQTQIYTED